MSKSLIIDPGHGGRDGGASGFGVLEKDWTLRISLYQYNRLKELGANVYLTRSTDYSLTNNNRTATIRNGNYDYCISNHWNAFGNGANGVETIHSLYANPRMATELCDALVKVSGLRKRRVFSQRHPRGGDYYFMHRETGRTQTTIIEYAFIDNHRDHNWYKNESNFYKAAEAVIEVLCKYLGVEYKTPSQTQNNAPKSPSKPKQPNPTNNEKDLVEGSKIGSKDKVTVEVALQDLQLETNQWGTSTVDVKGKFTAEEDIMTYFGSPNVNSTTGGMARKGWSTEFDQLALAGNHAWLRYRYNNRIKYIPFATRKDFENGVYKGTFK